MPRASRDNLRVSEVTNVLLAISILEDADADARAEEVMVRAHQDDRWRLIDA